MKKRSLVQYIVGVIIALLIVNVASWLIGGYERLHVVMLISVGFLLGMLAMYIAVHLYRWK